MDDDRHWDAGPERELATTRIFRVTSSRARSRQVAGRELDAVRLLCPDWVNVIALTPAREVVLIEQYRHGTRALTLEIPGGMVDDGETPSAACARELLEETGYAGEAVRLIAKLTPNPAFQDNHLHVGVVLGARLVAEPRLDGSEEVSVRLAGLDEVPGLIREGEIHHALVVAAFHHLGLSGLA